MHTWKRYKQHYGIPLSVIALFLFSAVNAGAGEKASGGAPVLLFEKGLPPLRVHVGGGRDSSPVSSGVSSGGGLKNLVAAPSRPEVPVPSSSEPVRLGGEEKISQPEPPRAEPAPQRKKEETPLPPGEDNRRRKPNEWGQKDEWYVPTPQKEKDEGGTGIEFPKFIVMENPADAIKYKLEVKLSVPVTPTRGNLKSIQAVLEKRLVERYSRHPRGADKVGRVEVLLLKPLRYSLDGRLIHAEFDQRVYDRQGNRMPVLEQEYFLVTFKGGRII